MGTVNGKSYVGGIAGNTKARLSNSSSKGTVTGTDSYIGGIVGRADENALIFRCNVSGDVKGDVIVGGVAGEARKSTIEICSYDNGTVSGAKHLGGIAGNGNDAFVTDCKTGDKAKIDGGDYVGGIIGVSTNPVEKCENHANVKGNDRVGGIAGRTTKGGKKYGTVDKCTNYGDITGVATTGGIAGEAKCSITNSENKGKVTGNPAGDIVGLDMRAPDTGTIAASKKHMLIIPIGVAVIFVAAVVVFFLVWRRKSSLTDEPETKDRDSENS